jgi:hypothetical protein
MERKPMVDPKCCERGRVSENFNMMLGTNFQFCKFIIAYNRTISISKQEQNMTETDINFSESFIYSKTKIVYNINEHRKDEREKFGCNKQLVKKQYFCILFDDLNQSTFCL